MTKLETLQFKTDCDPRAHGCDRSHPRCRGAVIRAAACPRRDVLTYLYFREMRIDPEQPQDPDRDRFVLSQGPLPPGSVCHGAGGARLLPGGGPAHAASAPSRAITAGHPDMRHRPGRRHVHRLPGPGRLRRRAAWRWQCQKAGQSRTYRVYALLGDGEIAEGAGLGGRPCPLRSTTSWTISAPS